MPLTSAYRPTPFVLPPHAPCASRLAGAWAGSDTAVITWKNATTAEKPRIATSPLRVPMTTNGVRRDRQAITPARAGRDPTRPGRPRPRRCSGGIRAAPPQDRAPPAPPRTAGSTLASPGGNRSEEHTSELQSQSNLVCRLLLEKKNKKK